MLPVNLIFWENLGEDGKMKPERKKIEKSPDDKIQNGTESHGIYISLIELKIMALKIKVYCNYFADHNGKNLIFLLLRYLICMRSSQ